MGLPAFRLLHQRARDHRKRADDRRFMLQPVFRAQSCNTSAKAVDNGHAARGRQQVR
jgi:hypothetical protein